MINAALRAAVAQARDLELEDKPATAVTLRKILREEHHAT